MGPSTSTSTIAMGLRHAQGAEGPAGCLRRPQGGRRADARDTARRRQYSLYKSTATQKNPILGPPYRQGVCRLMLGAAEFHYPDRRVCLQQDAGRVDRGHMFQIYTYRCGHGLIVGRVSAFITSLGQTTCVVKCQGIGLYKLRAEGFCLFARLCEQAEGTSATRGPYRALFTVSFLQ